jgi:hypothetical protein
MIIANIPSDSNNKRYWLIYDSKRKREREREGGFECLIMKRYKQIPSIHLHNISCMQNLIYISTFLAFK